MSVRTISCLLTGIPVLLMGCVHAQGVDCDSSHVLVSYNIRVDVASDGENAWPHRADRVASLLRFHGADIAGLQEAKKSQIDDLAERLPDHDWYGVGRDDGKDGGEFVPIFYRRDRFSVIDRGAFWLSPTPSDTGSVGWDAALPRITTWMLLEDGFERRFFIFNTHFDHRGDTARVESARLLRHMVNARAKDLPTVVMGDFNARPDAEPYRVMTTVEEGVVPLYDAVDVAKSVYGPDLTYGSFEVGNESDGRIDFIFLTGGFSVTRLGILTDQLRGRYPSDHLPVLVELGVPR